jgi:hypothetical protein
MSFRALEESSLQCALWNRKLIRMDQGQRRILVIHSDRLVGDTITYILGLRGFSAILATDVFAARGTIVVLNPHAILLDTRVGATKNYDFARELCVGEPGAKRLLIAMSKFESDESIESLRDAGYDGHSRRPCPMWQISDLLDSFFVLELDLDFDECLPTFST